MPGVQDLQLCCDMRLARVFDHWMMRWVHHPHPHTHPAPPSEAPALATGGSDCSLQSVMQSTKDDVLSMVAISMSSWVPHVKIAVVLCSQYHFVACSLAFAKVLWQLRNFESSQF
eukprot:evm.model.scf_39.1 EVM.evm.TU.scf_39.1   scf_39:390-734(-)